MTLGFALMVLAEGHVGAESTHREFTVAGSSMQPTLEPGDRIRVDLAYYAGHPVARNDLVALKFSKREHLMVKRVVAIAGDKVKLEGDLFRVNGEVLQSLDGDTPRHFTGKTSKVLAIQLKRYHGIVPERQVIVVGDNTRNSFDSGDFGLISLDQIAGKVLLPKEKTP